MAYSQKQKNKIVNNVCDDVSNGITTRKAILKQGIPFKTFYEWIDNDEEKSKQYARATELRAEYLAEEILTISDSTEDDVITDENGTPITNHGIIQRDKLRVDTRKWLMSKMMPTKYSDKMNIDHTTNGKEITEIKRTIVKPDNT